MNIYRAYDIGDTVNSRNNLNENQIKNIQTIFEKFVNVNKKIVKYHVPAEEQTNLEHVLVRLNQNIFSVGLENIEQSTINSELILIAQRLLQSETTKSSDGQTKSQAIKEGLLFLHLNDTKITIVKLEKSESINESSFAIQKGFGTSKEYLKTAIFRKDNFHEIDVMDKSNNIAKYWSDRFLGLERIRTDKDNTKTIIEKIDNDTIFNPSLIESVNPENFSSIKNQVLDFVSSEKHFSMDSLFASIDNAQDLNLTMSSIFAEDDAINYDDNFSIDQTVVNRRFQKTFIISDSISVKSQNLRKDLKDGYFSVEDGFFRIRIEDPSKENQLKTLIEESNYTENGRKFN